MEKSCVTVSVSADQQCSLQCTEFDKEDGSPVASPLDSLEAVLSWQPGLDELCVPVIPLRECPAVMSDPSAPKVVVCHDMMGGYQKDKFVQGHRNLEDYYFYHWQHIGAFIYFSHHFVSLPPPCWTNVAHRHRVLSLGTIITEWGDGAQLCHKLLGSEDTVALFAQQLVALAQYYHFDGWLVNIENPIHPPFLERMYMLLSLLTTGMHQACPGSKVIWYDSVTVAGELRWQNALNQLNQSFFDLCDGIFLNYNWTEEGLRSSSTLAGGRKGEVYVGIDVFGRGCPGGGGYNSCEALEAITRHGLSAALFAPGWVFETQNKTRFFQNQDRFWSLLSPYCLTSAAVKGLPLVSSFGRGCGKMVAVDGQVVYSGSWTNLSAQDLQLSFTTHNIVNDPQGAVTLGSVSVDTANAYNNGASLKLQGRVRRGGGTDGPALARLFKTDFGLRGPLLVCYTFKADSEPSGVRHYLQLHTTGHPSRVLLDPNTSPECNIKSEDLLPKYDLPKSPGLPCLLGCGHTHCVLAPLPQPYSSNLHQEFTGSTEQGTVWRTSYFLVQEEAISGSRVEEIGIALYSSSSSTSSERSFSLSIGEIKVLNPSCISSTLPLSSISNLECQDVICSKSDSTIALTLTWVVMNNRVDSIDHCNIYCSSMVGNHQDKDDTWKSDYVFLGRAHGCCFRVTNLYMLSQNLEESPFSLEFRVQPVTSSRRKPRVENSVCLLANIIP